MKGWVHFTATVIQLYMSFINIIIREFYLYKSLKTMLSPQTVHKVTSPTYQANAGK